MQVTLKPGIKYRHKFILPPTKTVPSLYPEAEEFRAMPEVFATGFLEWASIKALNPHLDWPAEQTVGTHSMSAMKRPPRPVLKSPPTWSLSKWMAGDWCSTSKPTTASTSSQRDVTSAW